MTAVSVIGLAQNPFLLPFVQLGADDARAALEGAMTREIDAAWIERALSEAIEAEDADRIETLFGIAEARGIPISAHVVAAAEPVTGPGRFLVDCGACAWDAALCDSARDVVICALPVELTPLGDLNALRRQAGLALAGEDVDSLEAGLATVGILATVAFVATGGTSAGLKAGASAVRVARRAGRLSPDFTRHLTRAADLQIDWRRIDDLALGRVELSAVLNMRRFDRLGGMVGDVMRVTSNTSAFDMMALLPRVDTPGDLRGLARLSDVAGDATRPAVETLGLARAMRAITRVTDLVLAVIGGVIGLLSYLAGLILSGLVRRVSKRRAQGLH